MYKIVVFEDEDKSFYEGVPASWVIDIGEGEFCYWPSHSHQISNLIKKCAEPSTSWKLYKCIVKIDATNYKDMLTKRKEVEKCTTEDVVSTESEVDYIEETSSEDYSLPTPPPKKKPLNNGET